MRKNSEGCFLISEGPWKTIRRGICPPWFVSYLSFSKVYGFYNPPCARWHIIYHLVNALEGNWGKKRRWHMSLQPPSIICAFTYSASDDMSSFSSLCSGEQRGEQVETSMAAGDCKATHTPSPIMWPCHFWLCRQKCCCYFTGCCSDETPTPTPISQGLLANLVLRQGRLSCHGSGLEVLQLPRVLYHL